MKTLTDLNASYLGQSLPDGAIYDLSNITEKFGSRIGRNEEVRTCEGLLPDALAALLRHQTRGVSCGLVETAMLGFSILKSEAPTPLKRAWMKPGLWLPVQGSLSAAIGHEHRTIPPGQALLIGTDLPSVCPYPGAAPFEPFLGLVIALDRPETLQAIEEMRPQHLPTRPRTSQTLCFELSDPMVDCLRRCLQLLEIPKAIRSLYPGILREICYWLLNGSEGDRVAQALAPNGLDRRIAQAIQHLHNKFTDQVCVKELADAAGMSPATFHRHFKAATSMSPLQYQKRLRLVEARRLMALGAWNVEGVAFKVGYESASYFSREYLRLFGKTPRRDVLTPRTA